MRHRRTGRTIAPAAGELADRDRHPDLRLQRVRLGGHGGGTRLTLGRPWRLLTGASLGAALGVKWSGAYAGLLVVALLIAWETAASREGHEDRKRTRLNSSHGANSHGGF